MKPSDARSVPAGCRSSLDEVDRRDTRPQRSNRRAPSSESQTLPHEVGFTGKEILVGWPAAIVNSSSWNEKDPALAKNSLPAPGRNRTIAEPVSDEPPNFTLPSARETESRLTLRLEKLVRFTA